MSFLNATYTAIFASIMIAIKDVLAHMHAGKPFSLRAVRYDKRRRERIGQIIEVPEAVLVWGDGGNDRVAQLPEQRQPTALERSYFAAEEAPRKNPNHEANYTRNIRMLVDGQPTESMMKIHPLLIIQFNGQVTTP